MASQCIVDWRSTWRTTGATAPIPMEQDSAASASALLLADEGSRYLQTHLAIAEYAVDRSTRMCNECIRPTKGVVCQGSLVNWWNISDWYVAASLPPVSNVLTKATTYPKQARPLDAPHTRSWTGLFLFGTLNRFMDTKLVGRAYWSCMNKLLNHTKSSLSVLRNREQLGLLSPIFSHARLFAFRTLESYPTRIRFGYQATVAMRRMKKTKVIERCFQSLTCVPQCQCEKHLALSAFWHLHHGGNSSAHCLRVDYSVAFACDRDCGIEGIHAHLHETVFPR